MKRRKKTKAEKIEESIRWFEYKERREREKGPLKSPCLPLRRRHCFGRGVGKIHKNCIWCGKSREQIKKEQKGK